jgi:hypothetical protein
MKRRSTLAVSFGLAFAVMVITSSVEAADAAAKNGKSKKGAESAKPAIEVVSLTIHPAAAPKPALKYHLLPTFLESTPGDAVPLYMKALVRHMEIWKDMQNEALDRFNKNESPSGFTHFEEWLETPLDKLPRERVRKLADAFGGSVRSQLELAVRREHCNWDVPLRQGHVFEILLPEVQEFRNMARIVALRARLQIAERKFDEAITSLQTGYGMARHVAKQPFLVSGLNGLAIANMMNDQVLALCQQAGSPNLYWSLTELPSPLIDPQTSIEAEYDGLYLQWPELQTLRHTQYVPEQWDHVLRKVVSELVGYEDDFARSRASDKQRAKEIAKTLSHALAEAPRAKAALLAAGYSQTELDSMPPAQVVLLYSLDIYDAIRDEFFQWWHLPYPQAAEGMSRTERELPALMKREIVPFARTLLPHVSIAMSAFARTERQLAAVRCIEALRIYAAAHNGQLPPTLDAIKQVPIPLNPMTGKPFPYHLEGKTAVLDADGGLTSTPRPQYRIVVAK